LIAGLAARATPYRAGQKEALKMWSKPAFARSIRNSHSAHGSELERIVAASPVLAGFLGEWPRVGLPDCWLVAGAVAQAVWNHRFGLSPNYGLKDVDIVYFDGTDLSEGAEHRHEERIRCHFAHLPANIDVKNEARVHLWYAAKFGKPLPPYTSSTHAIATFPTTATSIGIRPGPTGLEIEAPYGLADLFALVVRPNKKQITRDVYEAKIGRWRRLWPDLQMFPWEGT
jgi:uncharacterized protein